MIRDKVTEGCEWVSAGEGVATQKHDGTSCLWQDGKLYKRYTLKRGKQAPDSFRPATEPDPNTGKQQGWVPVDDGPEDEWHREALPDRQLLEGCTYELCGPRVQGNPEGLDGYVLIKHGSIVLSGVPRDFDGLRDYLEGQDIEGIVWHHPDGRMAKVKGKDFGLKRSTVGCQ